MFETQQPAVVRFKLFDGEMNSTSNGDLSNNGMEDKVENWFCCLACPGACANDLARISALCAVWCYRAATPFSTYGLAWFCLAGGALSLTGRQDLTRPHWNLKRTTLDMVLPNGVDWMQFSASV